MLAPAPEGAALLPPFVGGRIDWTLRDVLFGLLWFFALFQIIPIPFVLPFAFAGTESELFFGASLVGGMGADIGLVVVAVFFTFRKYGGGWARLGLHAPTWWTLWWGLGAFVAAFALAAAYSGIIDWFDIDALRSQCDDQIPNEVLDSTLLMAITGVIVIGFAPVCEEVFFRGFIFPGMAKGWGFVAAIFISGLVFSAGHISLALHKTLVPILIIGAVFAAVYYKSGNIFSTMLAHLLFNTIAFVGLTQCDPDDAASLGWARELLAGVMGR
jgi:membrane protease YdiL (CAAX protease family)